jgi:hypothetical protein
MFLVPCPLTPSAGRLRQCSTDIRCLQVFSSKVSTQYVYTLLVCMLACVRIGLFFEFSVCTRTTQLQPSKRQHLMCFRSLNLSPPAVLALASLHLPCFVYCFGGRRVLVETDVRLTRAWEPIPLHCRYGDHVFDGIPHMPIQKRWVHGTVLEVDTLPGSHLGSLLNVDFLSDEPIPLTQATVPSLMAGRMLAAPGDEQKQCDLVCFGFAPLLRTKAVGDGSLAWRPGFSSSHLTSSRFLQVHASFERRECCYLVPSLNVNVCGVVVLLTTCLSATNHSLAHAHEHTLSHAHARAHTHAHTRTHTRTHTHTHAHTHTHVHAL